MPRRRLSVSPLGPGENPFADLALRYAHDLLAAVDLKKLEIGVVQRILRCDLMDEIGTTEPGFVRLARRESEAAPRTDLRKRIAGWETYARGPTPPRKPVGGFVGANLALIGALFGFDDADRELFEFIVVMRGSPVLTELVEAFGHVSLAAAASLVAAATSMRSTAVLQSLRRGRAARSGLLTVSGSESRDFTNRLELKEGVLDLVLTPGLDRDAILSRFLPASPPSTLAWSDFATVQEGAGIVRDLLAGALRTHRTGVNILLYGVTGTGKTELARLLATQLGTSIHIAGSADEEGDSPNAGERLSSLVLGQRLLESSNALLLFDELEDLFTWESQGLFGGRRQATGRMSKAWFNQLLEANPVPTVWISNNVDGVDPAFLRRFAYAVEFRAPGPKQRARMLERHLEASDSLSITDIDAIATRYAVPGATLGGAVSAARLVAPDGRADRRGIERMLAPMERLMNGGEAGRAMDFDAKSYRIDALNSPVDLVGLADRLAPWQPGSGLGITLCLHGPPGTGKSEFVKYLAHRMGRRVIHRRVSDLQSKWVGDTEKAIAAAFREAEEEGAVLLFDEADSFLRDRRGATHSWEATQVNEFLQRLECFRGVVACTTNLVHELDEASLRRFVFKIPFGFLGAEQAATLFESVFAGHLDRAMTAAEVSDVTASLSRIGQLAPGDFAAVGRRFAALGSRVTVAECLTELSIEVRAKSRTSSGVVGFSARRAVA